MPRNLMVSEPPPGILDFQDAVIGPFSYDVICLFKDAFLSWPAPRVEAWLRDYWERARAEQLPLPERFEEFRRQADWMGMQRHLKVAGIFARLTYRDGKPQYVADTPRFVRYLMDVAPQYPELSPLVSLLERHVLPRTES
jgi:N-acetylmuramate 1-kinase